jgi:23S rRNA pseudouridine1911/1915/1917 synthase
MTRIPLSLREATARLGRQALHAQRLALQHPAQNELMSWESEIPEDIENLLALLEGTDEY